MPSYVEPQRRERARKLRRDMTGCEKRVWANLKAHRQGTHFRRQVPIGPYTADFACHAAKLIIEIDGDQHARGSQMISDLKRDAWLASRGYRTLRFSNGQVMNEFESVIMTIEAAIQGILDDEVYARTPAAARAGQNSSLPPCGGEMERGQGRHPESSALGCRPESPVPPPPNPPPQGGRASSASPSEVRECFEDGEP